MSKKNSSVNLKNGFKDFKDLSNIFLNFKNKLNLLNKKIHWSINYSRVCWNKIGTKKNRIIYGGILKSCSYIIKSEFFNSFDIYKFDSSQITNPPPTFIIRLFLSLKRLLSFFIKILLQKPNVVLVFCSDGWSAIEKGLMLYYCKIFL